MPFSLTIHLTCDSFSFMLFGLAGSTYLRNLLLHAHTPLFSVAVRVVRLPLADSIYLEKGRTTFWIREDQNSAKRLNIHAALIRHAVS